jgi:hypothetical protein
MCMNRLCSYTLGTRVVGSVEGSYMAKSMLALESVFRVVMSALLDDKLDVTASIVFRVIDEWVLRALKRGLQSISTGK